MDCKVGIVGAGIAGLMAAKELTNAGIKDFYLIEAEDRVGGRIHSESIHGNYLEYGAQWLHGEENELKELSNGLLSDVESFEGEGLFISDEGEELNPEIVNAVGAVVLKILNQCENLRDDPSINFSVGEYLKINYDSYVSQNIQSDDEIRLWKNLFSWHTKFYEIDNSCDSLYDLSAREWGLYDFNGEDNQRHINYNKGYVSLLHRIMAKIPSKSIHLKTRVNEIKWKINEQKRVIVSTDKYRYVCDHVIVTVSLGVLKNRYKSMFCPNLPLEYERAICCLGFSGFGKIFLQFSEAWWGEAKGYQFVWTDRRTRLKKKLKKKNALWVKYITGLDIVAVGPPNCLVAWITAEGTRKMESLTDNKIEKDLIYFLKLILQRDLPRVCFMKRTSWMSNQSFKGCYSNLTMESEKYKVGPATLAVPIYVANNHPILLFAGEATHEKYFSTTHGAAETGIRQARVIIESH